MYPKNVTIAGISYSVHVERSRDGEIEYFQLQDPNGEFYLESDWQGSISEEDILELL